jgi:hypothetical protein
MPSTIYGPPVVELQDDRDFEPIKGDTRVRTFRGRRADVEAYLVALQLQNFPYTISADEGGLCTAKVTLGAGDTQDPNDPDYNPNTPISIEWNFSSNRLERPLWEHPKVIEKIAALTQTDQFNLRKWINEMIDAGKPSAPVSPSALADADINAMANKIIRGIDTFYVPQATLVENMRFTPATTFWPYLGTVSTVYKNQDLSDVFHAPADVLSVLPQGEWLLTRQDYQRDSAGYRNNTLEWEYAKKWDAWIYPHFPVPPLSDELIAQMNGIMLRFEDWLKIRFPGLPQAMTVTS